MNIICSLSQVRSNTRNRPLERSSNERDTAKSQETALATEIQDIFLNKSLTKTNERTSARAHLLTCIVPQEASFCMMGSCFSQPTPKSRSHSYHRPHNHPSSSIELNYHRPSHHSPRSQGPPQINYYQPSTSSNEWQPTHPEYPDPHHLSVPSRSYNSGGGSMSGNGSRRRSISEEMGDPYRHHGDPYGLYGTHRGRA